MAGGAGDTPLGYDPVTGTYGTPSTQSTVRLDVAGNQTLASLSAYCNTGTATLAIVSQNNFKLVNGNIRRVVLGDSIGTVVEE